MTKDPVCGMEIKPETAPAKSQHQGQTYYFCCVDCKRKFDEDPSRYAARQGPKPAAVAK